MKKNNSTDVENTTSRRCDIFLSLDTCYIQCYALSTRRARKGKQQEIDVYECDSLFKEVRRLFVMGTDPIVKESEAYGHTHRGKVAETVDVKVYQYSGFFVERRITCWPCYDFHKITYSDEFMRFVRRLNRLYSKAFGDDNTLK